LFDATAPRKVVSTLRIGEIAVQYTIGAADFALPKLAPVAPKSPFWYICTQGGSEPRRA
jgi:hypothetical protein